MTACSSSSGTSAPASGSVAAGGAADVKIAMVVHGGAGDAFWSDVKTGGEDAASLTGVQLDYQTSDDLKQQGDFINAAVAQKVQGLIVSVPTVEALTAPIKAAEDAGIPVMVINSGADDWEALGAVGFVGQQESVAGEAAGKAMKDAGVTSLLCVNITQVIKAVDQRCESATESFGGPVETVRIDPAARGRDRANHCNAAVKPLHRRGSAARCRGLPAVVGGDQAGELVRKDRHLRRDQRDHRWCQGWLRRVCDRPAALYPGLSGGDQRGAADQQEPAHRRRHHTGRVRSAGAHRDQHRLTPPPKKTRSHNTFE